MIPLHDPDGTLGDFVRRVEQACVAAVASRVASGLPGQPAAPAAPVETAERNAMSHSQCTAPDDASDPMSYFSSTPRSFDTGASQDSTDTQENDQGKTENGALAEHISDFSTFVVKFGNPGCSGFGSGYPTPGMAMRAEVQRSFKMLWNIDPVRAFRHAMMLGNLRHGLGGYANMDAWMACMEIVWEKDPHLLIRNIEHIMQDTSYKWGLTLLKHFSNNYGPDDRIQNRNNYWGNLAHANQHTISRFLMRPAWVMEVQGQKRPHPATPYALHQGEIFNMQPCGPSAPKFQRDLQDSSQARRKHKFVAKYVSSPPPL